MGATRDGFGVRGFRGMGEGGRERVGGGREAVVDVDAMAGAVTAKGRNEEGRG